jgi:hypothetical protein
LIYNKIFSSCTVIIEFKLASDNNNTFDEKKLKSKSKYALHTFLLKCYLSEQDMFVNTLVSAYKQVLNCNIEQMKKNKSYFATLLTIFKLQSCKAS